MRVRVNQAILLGVLIALGVPMCAAEPAATAPTTAPAVSSAQRGQLVAQCDALLADAVRTPFGWGWTGPGNDVDGDDAPAKGAEPQAPPHGGAKIPPKKPLSAKPASGGPRRPV